MKASLTLLDLGAASRKTLGSTVIESGDNGACPGQYFTPGC